MNTSKVYQYIIDYKTSNDGNSPSTRDIQFGVGMSSTSVVNWHLKKLEELALIKRARDSSRSIIVIGGQWSPPD